MMRIKLSKSSLSSLILDINGLEKVFIIFKRFHRSTNCTQTLANKERFPRKLLEMFRYFPYFLCMLVHIPVRSMNHLKQSIEKQR